MNRISKNNLYSFSSKSQPFFKVKTDQLSMQSYMYRIYQNSLLSFGGMLVTANLLAPVSGSMMMPGFILSIGGVFSFSM